MRVSTREFEVKTTSKFQSIDITEEVQNSIGEVKEGVAFIFVKHTTCSIIVNEPEGGLMEDYLNWIRKLIPPEGEFRHNAVDNNGHATFQQ